MSNSANKTKEQCWVMVTGYFVLGIIWLSSASLGRSWHRAHCCRALPSANNTFLLRHDINLGYEFTEENKLALLRKSLQIIKLHAKYFGCDRQCKGGKKTCDYTGKKPLERQ